MKKFASILSLTALAAGQGLSTTYGGSGPYTSYYHEEPTIVNHTFYQPLSSALGKGDVKLPVVIWANGACTNDGLGFRSLLGDVASYGVMVIANGPVDVALDPAAFPSTPTGVPISPRRRGSRRRQTLPPGGLPIDPQRLFDVLDWLDTHAGKGNYTNVDKSRIGVWGQSCGGFEAYSTASDRRVGHIALFNSGEISDADSISVAGNLTKPLFIFLGGPSDIAYTNGQRDYSNVPKSTPAWIGSHGLGHVGAFMKSDAGPAGVAGQKLAQWLLRGDVSAKNWFSGNGSVQAGYSNISFHALDNIKVTPI